ncbi:MAG: hydroxymethylglutaryl-CoA synthase, partial [Methanoregulaceae archaeon]|nr:hydroxymethylglutaryl-CoA synthase [Methanoregulaceae archaeon]
EAIGATPRMTAADFEFACKAGTAGIQTCMGLVKSGMVKFGMAIGSDVAQGAPSDALEYTSAAGGAAYILGNDDPIATIHHTCSYTTDTPDFWRREGQGYPRHGGRFTGEPGYFRHIEGAVKLCFEQTGKSPGDYDYAVFHQPNAKFPQRVAKTLGFSLDQIEPGLVVPRLGNTYSGSSIIGLAATLDVAKPGERIFMASFGSGAGSDAFDIEVTDAIESDMFSRDAAPTVETLLKNPIYIQYAQYARHKGKIVMQK